MKGLNHLFLWAMKQNWKCSAVKNIADEIATTDACTPNAVAGG